MYSLMTFQCFRADQNISLRISRWLEALWEPGARLYTMPNGLDMVDITGDGDARLICADLGVLGVNSTKVATFYCL